MKYTGGPGDYCWEQLLQMLNRIYNYATAFLQSSTADVQRENAVDGNL